MYKLFNNVVQAFAVVWKLLWVSLIKVLLLVHQPESLNDFIRFNVVIKSHFIE